MQRRQFLQQSILAGAAAVTGTTAMAGTQRSTSIAEKPFQLDYAFHAGMFKNNAGDSFLDQIR